jgi:hypothetical protein
MAESTSNIFLRRSEPTFATEQRISPRIQREVPWGRARFGGAGSIFFAKSREGKKGLGVKVAQKKKSRIKANKKVTPTKAAKVNLDNIIHHPFTFSEH